MQPENECVVCYAENCTDCIPCEVCKKVICINCASQMASISGFFCPACKAGKNAGGNGGYVPDDEEKARIDLFQSLRDAFDDMLRDVNPVVTIGFLEIDDATGATGGSDYIQFSYMPLNWDLPPSSPTGPSP